MRRTALLTALLFAATVSLLAVSWTYEQDFESLSTGDLNGQDSWSGNTTYDVTTAVACGGTKSVGVLIGDSQSIQRTLPAEVQDGDFYVQVRRTGTNDGDVFVNLLEDDTNRVFIRIGENGDVEGYNGTVYVDLLAGYSANTCLTINVQFNDSSQPDQWRARVHNGSSWGSFSSWLGVNGTYGSIHKIKFDTGSGTETQTAYFDTIDLSDPTGGGGGGSTAKVLTLLGVGLR